MRLVVLTLAGTLIVLSVPVLGQTEPKGSPYRPPVGFEQEPRPPQIPAPIRDDRRVTRAWPEQPPVIPHSIENYQLDLNTNTCLTCHSRRFTEAVQAPMISITHYVNREGQMLGAVSPRRYFCTQCHVPQTEARVIVENRFIPFDELVERPGEPRQ